MMLLRPLKQLANVNSDMQRGISAAQSIFLVLDEEMEKDTGTVAVDKVKGLIEVKNVTFKYPTKDEACIKRFITND